MNIKRFSAYRVFTYSLVTLATLFLIAVAVFFALRGEDMHSPAPTVNVPDSPWIMADTKNAGLNKRGAELFASCASCHMADGSGRADGTVPRLAGKSQQQIIQKLISFRDGSRYVPAMMPFARALKSEQVSEVARYISQLPTPSTLSQGDQL